MSEWQPMETAPRDGTAILGCVKEGITSIKWMEWDFDGCDGWYLSIPGAYASNDEANNPTHWMPLPDSPK